MEGVAGRALTIGAAARPTGRKVVLPHVVVMKFEGDKIAHEHIYWDQACLLAQIGLRAILNAV
jgi:hypothetical protein